MKNILSILTFVLLLLLSQNSLAQHRHLGAHPNRNLIEKYKTELQLSTEQEQQLNEIRGRYKADFQKLRSEETNDYLVKRELMQGLFKAQKKEIEHVLTADQRSFLETKKKELRQQRLERRKQMEDKIDLEGLRAEIKTYREQNIQPVLLVQRAKLEPELSEEDKATIAQLRPVFKKVQQEMRQRRKAFKESGKRPTEKERQQMNNQRESHKKQLETLNGLVEKYDANIEALFSEIESQQKKWKEVQNAIYRKYFSKVKKDSKGRQQSNEERLYRGKDGRHRQHMKKGRFLLMDPNKITAATSTPDVIKEVSVYPNPAGNTSTLTYTLQTAGKVTIEFRNERGDVVKVLANNFQEAGVYKQEVDLSDLKAGVYYFTITSGKGVVSKKVVVSK